MAIFGKTTKEKKATSTANAGKKTIARSKRPVNGAEHSIIVAPWFSEKALLATEKGVYAFEVPRSATKAEIAGAVKEIYNVSPKAIRIVNLPAKSKALRSRRGFGVRARRRKAYVYLNSGDTIQFA